MSFVDHDTGRNRRSPVADVRRVSPHIVRVTLAGDDLADYRDNGTDQHLALLLFDPRARVPHPLTEAERLRMRPFVRPQLRRYSIRRFDARAGRLDVDVVVHDDDPDPGPGARWALGVRPGDRVWWWGPTNAWRPAPATRHVLAVGDETALPAIAALVEQLPPTVRVTVLAEVADPGDATYLDDLGVPPGRAEVTWIHRRGPRGDGSPELLDALRRFRHGPGPAQVWGAGEYTGVQAMRRHLHGERGLDRQDAYLVTYWVHGHAQDARPDRRDARETAANRAADPGAAREFLP